jgi:hypothetical protein
MRSWLQKIDEIVRVPRFSRRTRASGDPAENRLIVRNGTVTIGGMFEHSDSQTLNYQLIRSGS